MADDISEPLFLYKLYYYCFMEKQNFLQQIPCTFNMEGGVCIDKYVTQF